MQLKRRQKARECADPEVVAKLQALAQHARRRRGEGEMKQNSRLIMNVILLSLY